MIPGPANQPHSQTDRPPAERAGVVTATWSGPLPPPRLLGEYESVCAGAADRILRVMENEASHRHDCERRDLDSEIETRRAEASAFKRGQLFALLIALTGFGLSAWVLMSAQTTGTAVGGSILGVGSITTIVLAFLRRSDDPRLPSPSEEAGKAPAPNSKGSKRKQR